MSLGAGLCPAGFSDGGYGTPDAATPTLNTILIDASGRPQNARSLNWRTGDYNRDSRGRPLGMSGVEQLVELAVATVRNSSAVRDFGKQAAPKVVGQNYKQQLLAEVQECLADLISGNLIRLLGVDISQITPTQTREVVRWFDLTTGVEKLSEL